MPDLVISCVVLVLCAGALALSFTYSPVVSLLLPRLAAGLGILCAGLMIASTSRALASRREKTKTVGTTSPVEERTTVPDPTEAGVDVDPNDAEYVLSHTSRGVWLSTLGFIVGFFLVLYLCGLFVAAAALSLSYLVVVGKKSWLFASMYAVVLTGLLWILMRWVTYIPSPRGVLFSGG
ncbi:hypothetical protein [Nesterenkonia sp. CF4.4]|uniref:hypothetical protein n=1 Tax=Nesterenkonia sp. CF4.4 TaxID=3373079 RepID=UPI003EE75BC4